MNQFRAGESASVRPRTRIVDTRQVFKFLTGLDLPHIALIPDAFLDRQHINMAAALYIDSTKSPLPAHTPNLMPFHIEYSGPAPISTYFRAKPIPPPTYGSVQRENTPEATSQNIDSQAEDSQETIMAETPAAGSSSSTLAIESASSSATLVNDVEMAPAGISQASPQRHFAAAFRGRAMHGLQVDLPDGYSGLVFQAPNTNDTRDHETAASKKGKSRATELNRPGRRSRGKRNDGDETVDLTVEEDAEMKDDEGEADEQERILRPTATFSSFVLWNPDIPVDEGRDEYVRSLTEWIKLSAEVNELASYQIQVN